MLEATYNGQKIRVEARILFVTDLKEITKITKILTGNFISYKLTIGDSEPKELTGGFLGIYRLEGFIFKENASKDQSKVTVTIDQGLLGAKYTLTINDKEYELKKL